jgi:toxin ParE1/3/4
MQREVLITAGAEQDLAAIFDYIAEFDSPGAAIHVLDRLQEAIDKLAHFAERGAYPRELVQLGIRDHRQVFFKPYRVIYKIDTDRVFVFVIADGRRDMASLLTRRLVSGT